MEGGVDAQAVTALLQRWSLGDHEALENVLPLLYKELRAIARSYMSRERSGHTLGVTGLVHEAFLRMAGQSPAWQDRKHFYGIAARLMRQVLVDYSRHHGARKRDKDQADWSLQSESEIPKELGTDYLLLDECLVGLEETDQRKAEIIELRFFGGLTIQEIAEAKNVSASLVKKELTLAKLWLYQRIQGGAVDSRQQPKG